MPSASLRISNAIRRLGQPTARRIPISRIRSKTDIAIVFITPMPPTISASTETTQPTSMINRDDVSTFTACPGSTIAEIPKRFSSRVATVCGVCPSFTVTASVVTSPGRFASRCTVASGSTTP